MLRLSRWWTFKTLAGLLLMLYAVGFFLRPATGVAGYIVNEFQIPLIWVEIAFFVCGVAMIIFQPRSLLFAVLTAPLALYAFTGVVWIFAHPGNTIVGVLGHFAFWAAMNAYAYREAAVWNP